MSYDIIQSIKNNLSTIQGGLDEDTKAVAGSGGSSKRISIKGGVFRKFANGKEVGAIEDRYMEIIFVKMAHDPSRTYYTQGYKEGERVSPSCWSTNSKTPDAEVKSPMASRCDQCQMSVKGSGQNGTGTACRLSWRTAVILPNDPAGDVMQLVLPPTSCFGKEENGKYPFRPYIQYLASHNISAGRVITRMQFDTKSATPKLLFSPVGAVNPSDMETVLGQGKSSAAESAVKLTVYQQDEGEAPVQSDVAVETATEEAIKEPVLRESASTTTASADVSDVLKKWGKKK